MLKKERTGETNAFAVIGRYVIKSERLVLVYWGRRGGNETITNVAFLWLRNTDGEPNS